MRICHVVRGMVHSSGPTHIVVGLCEAQARLGHEITLRHVATGDKPGVEPNPRLVRTECFPAEAHVQRLGYSPLFRKAMRGTIHDYDLVHIHAVWNYPSYEAMRTAKRAGVPFIVAPQGSLDPWALKWHRFRKFLWVRMLEGPLLRQSNALHALTDREVSDARRFGVRSPICVVPNGVYVPREVPADETQTHGAEKCVTFLFLSRIHPKKGLDVLAAALARLGSCDRAWRLLIAGHDAGSGYLKTVEAMFAAQGVLAKCDFLGDVRGDCKEAVYAKADAFVLPSYSEGIPVAALEAMAAGLPVLLTPGCNLPDVEDAGAGYVVPQDPIGIADAMRLLLQNDEMRREMGGRARRLVQQKFTWPEIARRMVGVYEWLVGGGTPPECVRMAHD